MSRAAEFLASYITTFNTAVASGDFAPLLARYADDAVLRFENVPPDAGTVEFAGRDAYTAAYADQPPDDQIDLIGEPAERDGHLVAGFAWRKDSTAGVLDLTVSGGMISQVTVIFG